MNSSLVPTNIRDFYSSCDATTLYQGDVLDAKTLGWWKPDAEYSPHHWMIITKNCDLVIDPETRQMRRQTLSLLPLVATRLLPRLFSRDAAKILAAANGKLALLPVFRLLLIPDIKKDAIDNIISGKVSRFFFLPPDGAVLVEPSIIDFDIVRQLGSLETGVIDRTLNSKRLQLSSPLREAIAQRFGLHYSSIGLQDDEIRSKDYRKLVKTLMDGSRSA